MIRWKFWKAVALATCMLLLGSCTAEVGDGTETTGEQGQAWTSGTYVPLGQLEAVGVVRDSNSRCTGTLINQRYVLTAAHCFCPEGGMCSTRGTFKFTDVRTASDPEVRDDVEINGDVIVHPDFEYLSFGRTKWDMALLRLDDYAYNHVYGVTPYRVHLSAGFPAGGDDAQVVGYGRSGSFCLVDDGRKVQKMVQLQSTSDETVEVDDSQSTACAGDSGGFVLYYVNGTPQVIGVMSYVYDQVLDKNSVFASTKGAYLFLRNACPGRYDPTRTDWSFCNDPLCGCAAEEGDCDNDYQCNYPLTCHHDVGAAYGQPSTLDMCLACPTFNPSQPDPNFCNNPNCPCSIGQGDCDSDAQCEGSLVCGLNNGADYGLPSYYEVCINPGVPCGNGQADAFEECDDGNRDGGDGCSASCTVENGWTCPQVGPCVYLPPCFPNCGGLEL